ncbi:DUF4440 domain-containing protein [Gordonia sp. CPCC 206044]|uniref:DUF4440 domain-containing protein n=1 Tax=Gordonia sp. CPCC 206044 TaxID=3140793 RepID=UPI003AF3DF38
MTNTRSALDRPAVDRAPSPVPIAVDALLAHLQDGLDTGAADVYDAMFTDDILWGTPKGEVLQGYRKLNTIHHRLLAEGVAPASDFEVAQTITPAPGVVVTQIRRRARAGGFSEMAMYVLVQRGGQWWVAAVQNTPISAGVRHG